MQEYTINGTIITENISPRSIEAGTVCLMLKEDKYYRITITHVENSTGDWIVEGDYNGSLEKERPLFRLSVLTEHACFPIAFKDWKGIIEAGLVDTNNQTFLIKPKQFKAGKNVQTCSECNSTFLANKSQPYCKTCCNTLAVAYLHGNSKIRCAEKKYPYNFVRKLLRAAYEMGIARVTETDFNHWLTNKLDNGTNTHTEGNS